MRKMGKQLVSSVWQHFCTHTHTHSTSHPEVSQEKKNPPKTALFSVITQRVAVISYQCFGTTYHSHLHGSRIQKESRLSQCGVYIGQEGGQW